MGRYANRSARRGDASGLLGVAALARDGAVLRSDGVLVRLLEVGSVNALAVGDGECERVCLGLQRVLGRLPAGESLQLYANACALDLRGVIASERQRCAEAAGAAADSGRPGLAAAIEGLGAAGEEALRGQSEAACALRVRWVMVCPWRGGQGWGGRRGGAVEPGVLAGESLRHVEGIAGELEACGVSARLMDGGEVLDVLQERFCPGWDGLPASFTHPHVLAASAAAARVGEVDGDALAAAVCAQPIDLSDRARIGIGGCLEQVQHVSLPPERTWVGWLLHAMQSPAPWTVSVHVRATDRLRERGAQKRRYKRLYGVNRGVEGRGRPVDADEAAREREAAELLEELAASAGSGIYRMSVYIAVRDTGGPADPRRLDGFCKELAGELSMASDVRLLPGTFAQRDLWRSTLPLGLDVAARCRRYVSANVAETIAPAGSGCSSPDGIPVGVALPGRTLQRLDPFDPVHPNHLMLVNGVAGAGKTMASILLLCRAIAQGATGSIIDRAGHFAFLASLIPGAASVQIGDGAGAINPWDVDDPARVSAEKVDYLLALHALLLGEHHQARDSYGLGAPRESWRLDALRGLTDDQEQDQQAVSSGGAAAGGAPGARAS